MSNAEREARKIYHDKANLALATNPTLANRPLVCAPESMVTVNIEGELIPAFVKEGNAGVYLLEIRYPNGATEFGAFLEEDIQEKLN